MATNSSTAGFLAPSSNIAQPLYGDALDDVFHDTLQGITGIPGELVRPRFQPEPPNQPDFTTDWIAFGIVTTKGDVFSYQTHDPTGAGFNVQEYDEQLTVLHSFYGPNGQSVAGLYNAGIQVEQNRDVLTAAGIKLVECQEVTQLPALLKEKWVKRWDCRTVFRRRVSRSYPILTIESSVVHLDNELYTTIINIQTP